MTGNGSKNVFIRAPSATLLELACHNPVMSWNWYGVKTLHRTRTVGRPRNVDANYDREATLVEERVVLFRARNFDEAIDKGEAEAKKYAAAVSRKNRYGQRVRDEYLGCCDAFVIFDDPGVGCEVYSRTRVVPESVSDAKLAAAFVGDEPRPNPKREKFFDVELQPPVAARRR